MSVPATYAEPKGIFLLEAMATGVPVVQPRRGAFPEILETTGGGLLVDADDEEALAGGCSTCSRDPARAARARPGRRRRRARALQRRADGGGSRVVLLRSRLDTGDEYGMLDRVLAVEDVHRRRAAR